MYHNDKKYALTNCVLLDGSEHMEPQTGKAVCIDGEKINEIVDAQHIPAGYEAVDLGGKYVLPGLINMHVHLPASGRPKKKASDPKKLVKLITSCALTNKIGLNMCEGYAKTELLSGVGFGPFEGNVVKAVVVSDFHETRKFIDKTLADVELSLIHI